MIRVLARAAFRKPGRCKATPLPDAALISCTSGAIKWNKVSRPDPTLARIEELKREKVEARGRETRSCDEKIQKRAVTFFRNTFYGTPREIRGQLYDLMLLLYAGELCGKQQVTRDHDAQVMALVERLRNGSVPDAWLWLHMESAVHKEVRAFARSDDFLGPVEESRDKCENYKFQDLTVNEVSSLIHALHQPESLLAKLMKPDPLLTHHENFHTALEHARLFLLRAGLPIGFGLDVTYSDLANHVLKCESPDCRKKGETRKTLSTALLLSAKRRLDSPWFPFPSGVEAQLRNSTIDQHLKAHAEPLRRVEHLNPVHCPPDAHILVKRLMKTRRPFLTDGLDKGWKELIHQLDNDARAMEESEHDIYSEWANESPELRDLFMNHTVSPTKGGLTSATETFPARKRSLPFSPITCYPWQVPKEALRRLRQSSEQVNRSPHFYPPLPQQYAQQHRPSPAHNVYNNHLACERANKRWRTTRLALGVKKKR